MTEVVKSPCGSGTSSYVDKLITGYAGELIDTRFKGLTRLPFYRCIGGPTLARNKVSASHRRALFMFPSFSVFLYLLSLLCIFSSAVTPEIHSST